MLAVALVAFSLVGVVVPSLAIVAWLADVVLIAAVGADAWFAPSPSTYDVRRRVPRRAGQSRPFERALRVAAPRAAGLTLEIHEDRDVRIDCADPDHESRPETVRLPADGVVVLTREFIGRVRGRYGFGDLRVRVRGPLGLAWKQARVAGRQDLDVEPPMTDVDRVLALAASERWFDLGVRRLRRRGGQSEFDALREYVVGDDPRRIDHKAFARRGSPMVKEYVEERGQELVLLVDTGRRMGVETSEGARAGWSKLDHALDAALQLSAVALQAQDRVGIGLFDERLHSYIAPEKGVRRLEHLRRAVFDAKPSEHESDLGRALRQLSGLHRRRALVLVLSEVADHYESARQRTALVAGSRRHRLVFASLDDPAIRRAADGVDPVRAAERLAAFTLRDDRRAALAHLRGSGARILDAVPADSATEILTAWLDERRR